MTTPAGPAVRAAHAQAKRAARQAAEYRTVFRDACAALVAAGPENTEERAGAAAVAASVWVRATVRLARAEIDAAMARD